jgi:hypothetical protein
VEVVEARGGDGRVLVFAVRNPAGRVGELGGFGQPGATRLSVYGVRE